MEPEYALHYRALYEAHWWWRAREDLILRTLEDLSGGRPVGPILDVGCGDGLFFEKLLRFGDVEGVEMDPTGVAPDGPWIGRIQVRPFDETFQPRKRYALVLMLDVLEHFADPVRALRRAVELLDDGGAILLTVPAFRALWTSHDVLNRHYTRYTRRTLEAVVREAGARLEWSRYAFRWMAPLKLAASWKERLVPARPAPPRVPPAWLNRALYGLSRVEDRLIGRAPVPFGSSLFALARRA
jgi:SAM-dependent methyltransferase